MKNTKGTKFDIFRLMLGIFSVALLCVGGFRQINNDILKIDADGLAKIEAISSGVQRIAKLELENNYDDDLISELYDISLELSPEDENYIYFLENPDVISMVNDYIDLFYDFQETVINFRTNNNRDLLFASSEKHYEASNTIIRNVSSYTTNESSLVSNLETIMIMIVFIMGVLLIKILLNTVSELQKNKELSKDMFIDLSTGLYNRTKCQEILKNSVNPDKRRERAILIFDLNDLKKTNDSLGHRAGDSLISCFANELKNATKIFSYEVFVGRYGGDEFMAYFSSIQEKDILLYIEELNFLVDKFNQEGNKPFKLSFAVGYSITNDETKNLTMREIFDDADSNMYKNKIAMKAKKKADLEAEGIIVEEQQDDRL